MFELTLTASCIAPKWSKKRKTAEMCIKFTSSSFYKKSDIIDASKLWKEAIVLTFSYITSPFFRLNDNDEKTTCWCWWWRWHISGLQLTLIYFLLFIISSIRKGERGFFLIKSIFDSSLPRTCNSIHVLRTTWKNGQLYNVSYLKKFTTVHLQLSASAACSFSFPTCTKTWYQITRMSVCKLSSMVLYGSLLYFVNTRSATSSASANQCTKLRNPANIFYSL